MKKTISLASHPLIRGTFFLTLSGLLSRVMGFFYRIFLSRVIGAEGMGIYQLIFPVYSILHSLCASGIQTAISRLVAANASREKASFALRCGLALSLLLSLSAAFALYAFADPIARTFLSEERCAPLLQALAFALPLGSIHACINGYYYGLQHTAVPSITQLAEQSARMCFIWIAFRISLQEGRALSLSSTVWAIAAGEFFSTLYSVTAFTMKRPHLPSRSAPSGTSAGLSELISLALPLTANRLFVNLLSSAEAILIPARLQIHGHSPETSLVLYGALTGMAMPLILFPTAVTNSVSVLLLPEVARAQSSKNDRQISDSIQGTIKYCLLLGILFLGLFLLYGREMGTVLFHNALAGDILKSLSFICPFLYLSSTLASIINGLGKTAAVFLQNVCCLSLRIFFVLFLVPVFGIRGYLWGLLASLLLQTFLGFYTLRPYMKFSFPASEYILKPCLFLVIAVGCAFFLEPVFSCIPSSPELLALSVRVAAVALFYLLFLGLYQMLPKQYRIPCRQRKKNGI